VNKVVLFVFILYSFLGTRTTGLGCVMSLSMLEQVTLPAPSGEFNFAKIFAPIVIEKKTVNKGKTDEDVVEVEVCNKIGAFEIAYLGEQFRTFLEKELSKALELIALRPILLQYVNCVDPEPTAEILRLLGGPAGAVPLSWLVAVMADQKLSTSTLNKMKLDGSKNVFLTLDDEDQPCWVYVSLKDNRWYIGGGVPTQALAKNEGRRFFGRRIK